MLDLEINNRYYNNTKLLQFDTKGLEIWHEHCFWYEDQKSPIPEKYLDYIFFYFIISDIPSKMYVVKKM